MAEKSFLWIYFCREKSRYGREQCGLQQGLQDSYSGEKDAASSAVKAGRTAKKAAKTGKAAAKGEKKLFAMIPLPIK